MPAAGGTGAPGGPARRHPRGGKHLFENVQAVAAHESPGTTKLYDRTGDEMEKILL